MRKIFRVLYLYPSNVTSTHINERLDILVTCQRHDNIGYTI